MDAQESQRLVRGQKDRLDYEVRKFRRRRLVQYHDLEQDLLREVSGVNYFPSNPAARNTFANIVNEWNNVTGTEQKTESIGICSQHAVTSSWNDSGRASFKTFLVTSFVASSIGAGDQAAEVRSCLERKSTDNSTSNWARKSGNNFILSQALYFKLTVDIWGKN